MEESQKKDVDESTLSNFMEIQPKDLLLWEVEVDFGTRTLRCTATYKFVKQVSSVKEICLDTRGLTIQNIIYYHDHANNDKKKKETIKDWVLEEELANKSHLGQRLVIPLPSSSSSNSSEEKEVVMAIKYETSATNCTASQWLPPNQTSGKKHPYFFTQCQAIHARSLIPCMDCPAVKFTYCAMVIVPTWATPVMSGLLVNVNDNVHHWEQPVPIPSYLLALAVGDLECRDLSDRVRIWSEPSMIESAAWEFDDTERFLSIAESIADMPYPWKRYDLLCLPPSFPYGGMENPCLTFVTPTLLAGDRSLADVVAHEIAHSWTGNLVTNRTWGHFWLNEGWTTWLQRKIMVQHLSNPAFFDFDALSGWQDLKEDVNRLPIEATTLVWNMKEDDPDDWYSSVPYEKGFHLLYALERMVGSSPFLEFFQAYLQKFASLTVTSSEFQQFFTDFFTNHDTHNNIDISQFDWDAWLHATGMPPMDIQTLDRSLSNTAEQLAQSWLDIYTHDNNDDAGVIDDAFIPLTTTSMEDWTSPQKVCFLDSLLSKLDTPQNTTMDTTKILAMVRAMKKAYQLDTTKNCELLLRFSLLAILAHDTESYPLIIKFITSQGRMKYVRPIYRALFESSDKTTQQLAVSTFRQYADFYHPIASKLLASDLQINNTQQHKKEESSECILL